jgi:hypothetical protein
MKYTKDDSIFYQNNAASFVSYLTDKTAVIIVEAFPDFENTEVRGLCMGCMVGDSDNKLSCTCEDTESLLEMLEENTNPTQLPIIVPVGMIYDKPMTILKHEKELSELSEQRIKIVGDVKILCKDTFELEGSKLTLINEIDKLEIRMQDYAQLEREMSLEQFANRLAEMMARYMYVENDSRKVIGGKDEDDFNFGGKKYHIKVSASWDRSNWFDFEVIGIDFEYSHKGMGDM